MKALKGLKKNSGQALIEMVLLMGLVATCWIGATKILREQGVFQRVFGDSWSRLSNVIEFGVPTNGKNAGPVHPTSYIRHSTRRAE